MTKHVHQSEIRSMAIPMIKAKTYTHKYTAREVKSNKLDKQKYYNELHHMRETCSSLQSLLVCLCLLSICRSDFLSFGHGISLLLSDVTKSERTDNLLSHGQYD